MLRAFDKLHRINPASAMARCAQQRCDLAAGNSLGNGQRSLGRKSVESVAPWTELYGFASERVFVSRVRLAIRAQVTLLERTVLHDFARCPGDCQGTQVR